MLLKYGRKSKFDLLQMMLLRKSRTNFFWTSLPQQLRNRLFYSSANNNNIVKSLCKYLDITPAAAQYTCLKYPAITKLNDFKICEIVETMSNLGFNKKEIAEEPSIFSCLPITLHYRFKILEECGFNHINTKLVAEYLRVVKKNTIKQLKNSGLIHNTVNVENRLAGFMTQWPTSLTSFINGNIEENTLYELRLSIIQRYLEFIIDLSEHEFKRGIATYPNIKHRPLQTIGNALSLLTSIIMMPPQKLKSNLYLVHADPDNLKQMIYNIRSIAGVDIKEVLCMHPKLCCVNYRNIIATKKVFQDYGISNEAQSRCFEIFSLSPETVRERLESAKVLPEFEPFYHHPRFLKIIYYRKTVVNRMLNLYNVNKKCMSIDTLFGSDLKYRSFLKKPGDKLGSGKDILFCLAELLGKGYNMKIVRNAIKRHPFWMNVSVAHVKSIHAKLAKEFLPQDIYENCPILLYPWNKIQEGLKLYHSKLYGNCDNTENMKLSNSQILSLVLYYLEKDHYFSGNGIWAGEKLKIEPQPFLEERIQTC